MDLRLEHVEGSSLEASRHLPRAASNDVTTNKNASRACVNKQKLLRDQFSRPTTIDDIVASQDHIFVQ